MSWQLLWLYLVVFLVLIAQRIGAEKESTGSSVDVARMSVLEIEDALQVRIHPSIFFFYLVVFYVIMDAAIFLSFAPLCVKLTVDSNAHWFKT